jgi:hypothetical protein
MFPLQWGGCLNTVFKKRTRQRIICQPSVISSIVPEGAGWGSPFACKKIHKRVALMAVKDTGGGAAAKYGGIGLQFGVTILAFLFGGQWLDRKLGTSPIFLMLGVFVGAGAAFYSMYRKLMADQRKDEEQHR